MYDLRRAVLVHLIVFNINNMRTITDTPPNIHQGKNVKRFREMIGIRQEALADQLGLEWSQKRISLIESREIVDSNLLKSIADVLKIPVQVLENFDEQAAITYFNTFNNSSYTHEGEGGTVNNINTHHVDPLNLLAEAIKVLRELQSKNEALYENLLLVEREKNAALQARLN